MATHVLARLWQMLTMMLCGRVVIPMAGSWCCPPRRRSKAESMQVTSRQDAGWTNEQCQWKRRAALWKRGGALGGAMSLRFHGLEEHGLLRVSPIP